MSAHADAARMYWESAEARDWAAFGSVLATDVVYEMQQTRERVRGREAFVRFNQEYPGDWHLTIDRIVADDDGAATWTTFSVDRGVHDGHCVLHLRFCWSDRDRA